MLKMNDKDILELALHNQQTAWNILEHTGIIPAWERIGATVHFKCAKIQNIWIYSYK